MKKISQIVRDVPGHWVGDGFPVRSMFSYTTPGVEISPFLLLDHAGPADFPPSSSPRGVGQHPHRGFETVTIVYAGEVEHHDTAGNAGKIGPGDVQWMTAARGVLHEEMHGHDFTKQGGKLEMVQLWVNLPAKDKMSPPRYQEILDKTIPVVQLEGNAGQARIIAGDFNHVAGPAKTFTPVNLWDLRLNASHQMQMKIPAGYNAAMLVLNGCVLVNGEATLNATELAHFEREGADITIQTLQTSTILMMSGEPINEPIAGYGPFVMNTQVEIKQAIADFQAGRF